MTRYRQNPAVSVTLVDDETFLVAPVSEEVFHLDTIAGAVWRLLETPETPDAIAAVLAEAFPDQSATEIRTDLDRALAELAGAGLILSAP
ncbi:MAG: PqqD family protein [Alphaproteobacteria bacterium]